MFLYHQVPSVLRVEQLFKVESGSGRTQSEGLKVLMSMTEELSCRAQGGAARGAVAEVVLCDIATPV